MKVLIPMAGLGNRFKVAGYSQPKPLIEIDGRAMIAHVIEQFSDDDEFVFAVNQDHLDDGTIIPFLKNLAPNTKIHEIPYQPRGPVATALLLAETIDVDEPVIINYCDFSWAWDYDDFVTTMRETQCDASLVCYTGFHPNLLHSTSHATALEDNLWAHTIREKFSLTGDKMTDWTSSGTHYFKSIHLFKETCKALLQETDSAINGEHYLSQIMHKYCEQENSVRIYDIPFFLQWGDPENFEEYRAWSNHYTKNEKLAEQYQNADPRTKDYWQRYFSSHYYLNNAATKD